MKTTLKIQNVKCGGCANTIEIKIAELEGIENIEISVEQGSLTFDYDKRETLTEAKKLLTKIGYPIVSEHNSIEKKAKSLIGCVIGRGINK